MTTDPRSPADEARNDVAPRDEAIIASTQPAPAAEPDHMKRKSLRWSEAELAQLDAMVSRLRAKAAQGGLKPIDRAS